ncbi:MAG TPA: hypothetical protein VM536_22020 [Chloroflexia bacterium]|nr:hypothetical protein [Chloroflexia bacterium]
MGKQVIRGAPRYSGAATGGAVPAWIPEIDIAAGGASWRPAAVIILLPGGVRRVPLGRPGTHAFAPAAPPALAAESGATPSIIVPGGEAPTEDPRVAAAFGDARPIPGGVRVPLATGRSSTTAGPPALTPSGTLEITGQGVTFRKDAP